MARFRSGAISAPEAAVEFGVSRSQFYRMWNDYLRAVGERREASWQPGTSGGDRRHAWTVEVEALVDSLLKSDPPCSYSLVASEVQRRLGLSINRASVRRWAIAQGCAPDARWKAKPKPIRRWQVQSVGQLWQYDVSPHPWFAGRQEHYPLFEVLDDCSRVITGARLYPRETLLAHLDFLSQTFRREGLPLELYVDYHSFFFTQHPERLTQLAAALRFYQVTLRYAPTPQAKGKIERAHLFWQRRLPALLAAERILDLEPANRLLDQLRIHHNQKEEHREINAPPSAAWARAIEEGRSVLRPTPSCPWWSYVFSIQNSLKVGRDGRIPIGAERLPIDCSPGIRVTRCTHPSGDISVLLQPPRHDALPLVLTHFPAPKSSLNQPPTLFPF